MSFFRWYAHMWRLALFAPSQWDRFAGRLAILSVLAICCEIAALVIILTGAA